MKEETSLFLNDKESVTHQASNKIQRFYYQHLEVQSWESDREEVPDNSTSVTFNTRLASLLTNTCRTQLAIKLFGCNGKV